MTLAKILEKIDERWNAMPEGGTFVDLGSGLGKVCFGAALLHPFSKVLGIEIL